MNIPAIFDDEMKEIVESFIVETKELLEKLDNDLVELEKRPEDLEILNAIFRYVHTIKGTSSFIGFEQMSELAHRFEDVLNKLRKGELKVRSDIMDVMLEAHDLLKVLLSKLEKKDLTPIEIENVILKLEKIARGEVINRDEEATVEGEKFSTVNDGADVLQKVGSKVIDKTIRIDVERLDELINLVGELVLGRNRLMQIISGVVEKFEGEAATRELIDTVSQIEYLTSELQTVVMRARMLPIARVFNKFPRMVRDLAREMNKKVELLIYGEETEVDKSVIEYIYDPLVHIIRNAIDHGIESPEERIKVGKPEKGKIILKAEHEGNYIVITVEDDGRGIDPDKIRKRAIEKNLITEQEAMSISDKDILNFIFIPGFSTASKVTNVSGRGVGLDVVKANIMKLNGIIDLQSTPGVGTKFILKLPLTLAIIQGLLVGVAGEIFIIPLSSVVEVVRVKPDQVHSIKGREIIRLRDSILPLVRLEEIFNLKSNDHREKRNFYIVVLGLAEKKIGLVVDALIGQKEVVIKSLGSYLKNVKGIAGATILGDGTVRLIIDVAQVFKMSAKNSLDFIKL
ncbi:two-component system, chemotaxis family, sensor kinase CheA [Candidatus Kryptonium thompsonii]|uniref:histidine kinase n=2 Tax=Candidatus Kryptonium thompsonii TaxID=1633631 RepID=A0A0P1LEI2_9BACT|nr:chemotaxis protein CheA [Candidatus Kryptonium thompsoni]CUS77309.1 two-component system, chemotaxis family, sensor kinase CheA [Candidatus Kryptonium thompsoni]CUS78935.1 two-component system, chemotaxis family, sensor kinase CheA [Candidatus Kryptonium thompsoni]CUS79928.1 two-component system, chemotaxis family, sensor kinase CheA [Candidatus Kryptonium thompsoni]CUS86240.1 two-component system, chemotaxis family, sensor kinase CheA [Candidatus Kryptonium thompsoni]CUS93359.1 two-compone